MTCYIENTPKIIVLSFCAAAAFHYAIAVDQKALADTPGAPDGAVVTIVSSASDGAPQDMILGKEIDARTAIKRLFTDNG